MSVCPPACLQAGKNSYFFTVVRQQIIPAHVIAFLGSIPVQYCTASPVLSDKECNSSTQSGEYLCEQIQFLERVKVR